MIGCFWALDDYINPKTGKKIFGCANIFDHAAKQNQSKYPWAQNVVAVGLLKIVKGRWACLPLNYRFYHMKKSIEKMAGKSKIKFESKLDQAAQMITQIADVFTNTAIIVVTDSWFGNNGLWKPLTEKLGQRIHMISRLRSNNNVFELPDAYPKKGPGRPRKYGKKLGNTSSMADRYKHRVQEFSINLYGRVRTVVAYDRIVMLKTLKCPVRGGVGLSQDPGGCIIFNRFDAFRTGNYRILRRPLEDRGVFQRAETRHRQCGYPDAECDCR